MEFLAESIGLLDMDGGGAYASPNPHQQYLTPASPLTLSASSLNLFSTPPRNEANNGCESCCSNCNVDSNAAHDENDKLHCKPPTTAPTATIMPAIEIVLTKHITQRTDARTNHDCFTGNVDAITGHLIHGTMLYRKTGTVYEGSFITKYITTETATATNSNNNVSQSGQYNEKAATPCDTIPLRHGKNATCTWSNGMKFVGTFEYDRPKAGTWMGGGEWTYDGPLLVVVQEEKEQIGNGSVHKGMGSDNSHYGTLFDDGTPSLSKKHSVTSIIGIPHPLPGSVLFHGEGCFARSDGLVYEGEFHHGLANGVGKEIFVLNENGKGGTYYGEYKRGLRHGVGTLMESCDDESKSGECDECDCHGCEDDNGDGCGDECPNGQQGHMPFGNHESIMSRLDDNENFNCDNSSMDNVSSNNQSFDPGPDFAAGGTKPSTDSASVGSSSSSLPVPSNDISNSDNNNNIDTANDIAKPCIHVPNTDHTEHWYTPTALFQSPQPKTSQTSKQCKGSQCRRQPNKANKQLYSSGVWCAGQYEIEDCRGIVHSDSNEFTEEGRVVAAAAATTTTVSTTVGEGNTANGEYSTSTMAVSSLNRTTWDYLDEKWLGI